MHQLTDKKNTIVIYLFFLFILSTPNNLNYKEQEKNLSLTINKIDISGLSDIDNLKISEELNSIFDLNLFILKKDIINKIISKHNIVEEFFVKKIYPSQLDIKIKPTKLIAKVIRKNQLFVGANGKLIEAQKTEDILPNIFGKFNSKDFLELKENIENSQFKISDFKSIFFFPSRRWDLLTINNTLIKLPRDNLSKNLSLAYKIKKNDIFESKTIIDLRVANHLITK